MSKIQNIDNTTSYFNRVNDLSPSLIEYLINFTNNLYRQNVIDLLIASDNLARSKILERNGFLKNVNWRMIPSKNNRINNFILDQLNNNINSQLFINISEAYIKRFSVLQMIFNNDATIKQIKKHNQTSFDFKDKKLKLYDAKKRKYYDFEHDNSIITHSPFKKDAQPYSIIQSLALIILGKYYNLNKFWNIFNQRYAQPFVVGKSDDNNFKSTFLSMINNMGSSAGVAISKDDDIKFQSNNANNSSTYQRYIQKLNNEICFGLVGENLTTTSQKYGSYAQSKTHENTKTAVFHDILSTISTSINQQMIKTLCYYKFDQTQNIPQIEIYTPRTLDQKLEEDIQLQKLGISFTKKYIIENYDLEEDDFVLSTTDEDVEDIVGQI